MDLPEFRKSLQQELENILHYWMQYCVDHERGGFYGQVNNQNEANPDAPKGLILHARILWTFSSAYRHNKSRDYLEMADRSFNYLQQYFNDRLNGGLYWSVDATGQPLDTKKQAYALAFAMYGYSEYYLATGKDAAKTAAITLFNEIERYFYDVQAGGYIEALSANWQPMEDLRLSNKDANEPKTMNTHLHIIEAYTNLYRIWPDERLQQQLIHLLRLFQEKIISSETDHLNLFFSMDWTIQSNILSYGHDIEAAWLLLETAEVLNNKEWIFIMQKNAVSLAVAASRGLDADGGLWYEMDASTGHTIHEKHWWPQAEAMVGFYTAWQLSGDEQWLKNCFNTWRFIREKLMDTKYGEWYWGIDGVGNILEKEDKAGFWKCPYHNGRACLELIHRIKP